MTARSHPGPRASAAHRRGTAARIVAALAGGYGLAALVNVAALSLPIARGEAVLAGMLAGFLVWTAAAIGAFAARSASRAWAGLAVAALPLAAAAWPHLMHLVLGAP